MNEASKCCPKPEGRKTRTMNCPWKFDLKKLKQAVKLLNKLDKYQFDDNDKAPEWKELEAAEDLIKEVHESIENMTRFKRWMVDIDAQNLKEGR